MDLVIIQDNREEHEALSQLFSQQGYTVSCWLPTYEEAKSYISATRPNLVLLDVDFDGSSNGLLLAEWIKDSIGAPIILISERTGDRILDKAASLSPFFVSKEPKNYYRQVQVQTDLAWKIQRINTMKRKESILALPHFTKIWAEAKRKDPCSKGPDPRTLDRRRINYSDIAMITKDRDNGDYILIETVADGCYNHALSLREIMRLLPSSFIQIERGTIINSDHIEGRKNGRFILINGQPMKVGTRYLDRVNTTLSQLFD